MGSVSAVEAPEKKSPEAPKSLWARIKGGLAAAASAWKTITTSLVVLLVICFLWHDLSTARALSLALIGVPADLSASGFTSEVATEQLRDAIREVEAEANTSRGSEAVISDDDAQLNIDIPGTGLTTGSLAAWVQYFFHFAQHQVTGEFTDDNHRLSLTLRYNGNTVFFQTAASDGPDAAEALIFNGENGGAFQIVQATQPFIAASALDSWGDEQGAIQAADHVIHEAGADARDVEYAYNLIGFITYKGNNSTHSMTDWHADFNAAPDISIAHDNLGSSEIDFWNCSSKANASQLADAMGQFNTALSENKDDARAYDGAGNDEFMLATRLDAQDERSTDFNQAVRDYQRASALDPNYAAPHTGLGCVDGDKFYEEYDPQTSEAELTESDYLAAQVAISQAMQLLRFADLNDDPASSAAWAQKACNRLDGLAGSSASTADTVILWEYISELASAVNSEMQAFNKQTNGDESCVFPPKPS